MIKKCKNSLCQKEFFCYKSSNKKYCSLKCYITNPNYINPMKGKTRSDLSNYNKKYKSNQILGDKNPNKKKEVINKRLATINGKTKEIYGKKGDKNPNWRGGISKEGYPYEFNKELKLAIKIRDKYTCKICKKTEMEVGFLSIHHIDYNKKNNSLKNLISLCPSCHSKTNGSRLFWESYFSRSYKINKIKYSFSEIQQKIYKISDFLKNKNVSGIIPIPRGGCIPAVMLSHMLDKPIKTKVDSDDDILIDDIIDFGITLERYKKLYPKNIFTSIFINKNNFSKSCYPDFVVEEIEGWIVFPWENDIDENIDR